MNRRAFSVAGVLFVVLVLLALALPVSAGGKGNVLTVGPGHQYATIQAAVNAAKPGSTILVYPGTYNEAVSVSKNNLQIIAQGKDVIVVPPDMAGFAVSADRVTIRGFRIGFGTECASAIKFEGSHNTFADNYLYVHNPGCVGVEALVCADPDGGSDYNIIERNTVVGPNLGITIQTDAINTGNIIRDNTLQNVSLPITITNGKGFLVSGNTMDGSDFRGCIDVLAEGGNEVAQGYHTIVKNTMDNCVSSGIRLHAGPEAVLSHNRIAKNWIQNCMGDCLALEAEGGAALTHNEVISNSISLSIGANGVLLAADPDGAVSDNLIRDNLVYHNWQNGIYLAPGADRNRILHNEVQTNGDVGIRVAGDDNLIVGNWAHGNGRTDIADLGEGNKWRNNTYTPRVGWAGGRNVADVPAIVHTDDGGLTWRQQGVFPACTGCDVTDVSAVDDQTAWATLGSGDATGSRGAILHTTDGGATWVTQTIPAGLAGGMKGVKGLSRDEAWAASVGGVVLHTTDGGVTWNVVPHSGLSIAQVNRIDALDTGDVWIADLNLDGGGNPFMIHTLDNGLTWRQELLPDVEPEQGPLAVNALSPQVVWSALRGSDAVYRTVDGGAQWLKVASVHGLGDFDDICAASVETAWAVQVTASAGNIWRVHVAPNGSVDDQGFQPADTAYSYEGVTCRSDRIAWAVGLQWHVSQPTLPMGVIVSTVDGGDTWVQGTGPRDIFYWKVSFVGARR